MKIYMSFCDPNRPKGTQFLGACVVEVPACPDYEFIAPMEARMQGCNPGGEVMMVAIPKEREDMVKPEMMNRLLTRAELEAAWGPVHNVA